MYKMLKIVFCAHSLTLGEQNALFCLMCWLPLAKTYKTKNVSSYLILVA